MYYLDLLPQELLVEVCIILKAEAKVFLELNSYTSSAYNKYLELIKKGYIENLERWTREECSLVRNGDTLRYLGKYKGSSDKELNVIIAVIFSQFIDMVEENNRVDFINIKWIYFLVFSYIPLSCDFIYQTTNGFYVRIYSDFKGEGVWYSYNWKNFWNGIPKNLRERLLEINGYKKPSLLTLVYRYFFHTYYLFMIITFTIMWMFLST